MSANADARQNALDRVLDPAAATAAVGEELFAVADALSGSPSLRRALTDAGTAEEARVNVATSLFKGKVSDAALSVLLGAVKLAWSTTGSFVAAIERQGVRAVLEQARAAGQLDEVEDQLFKVGRAVERIPAARRPGRASGSRGAPAAVDRRRAGPKHRGDRDSWPEGVVASSVDLTLRNYLPRLPSFATAASLPSKPRPCRTTGRQAQDGAQPSGGPRRHPQCDRQSRRPRRSTRVDR